MTRSWFTTLFVGFRDGAGIRSINNYDKKWMEKYQNVYFLATLIIFKFDLSFYNISWLHQVKNTHHYTNKGWKLGNNLFTSLSCCANDVFIERLSRQPVSSVCTGLTFGAKIINLTLLNSLTIWSESLDLVNPRFSCNSGSLSVLRNENLS